MKEKACGLDLHKKFSLAAIIDQGGITVEHRFNCVARQTRLLRILTSAPGIGYIAAVTLIAEIGNFANEAILKL